MGIWCELLKKHVVGGVLGLPSELIDFPDSIHINDRNDLTSLGNLRSAKGGLFIRDCIHLRSFGDLETLNGPLECLNCPELVDTGRLRSVRGFINVGDTGIEQIPEHILLTPISPYLPTAKIASFARARAG